MAEPVTVAFGELLRQLRKDAGLTLEALAARAGLAVRTISDLERGKATSPHEATVSRLAWGLRLDGPARTRFEAVARGRPVIDGLPDGSATAPPRTLPRDIGSFIGRQAELDLLTGAAAVTGRVVAIYAVSGMAGVGKTALAVHAAHRLASRFPDGQIFLQLDAHTPGQRPLAPADALASLLQAAGVPAQEIPPGVEPRARLWRHWLAGKRLLVVLDDAADTAQVRPLLPGTAGSLVLVTTRRNLTALEDARAIRLDTLPAAEAEQLLTRLAARPGLHPDDAGVREVVRLCGSLPLAVGMLARQLHHRPARTAAGLAADLAAARNRLEFIRAEKLTVAAAFDLSYQDLTGGQQAMFRRLGLHPGTELSVHAAACLAGRDLDTARWHCEALCDHYLLTELADGFYRFHDLIREHARTKAAADDPADTGAATGRLLDHYQHAAARADAMLSSSTAPVAAAPADLAVPLPALADRGQALRWLRTERGGLLACIGHAARHGQHARVAALTAGLATLLRTDGPGHLALSLHAAAAAAAQQAGDRLGAAGALNELGVARDLTGDHTGAIQALRQAHGLYRAAGNRQGEANALNNLGAAHQLACDYPSAAQALRRALEISRGLGDRLGQASALRNLGFVLQATGDLPAATQALEQALDLTRALDDRQAEAITLDRLGFVRQLRGDYPGAARALERALEIYLSLGHGLGQANALIELGASRRLTGDFPVAARDLKRALRLYRQVGHQLGEAGALNELGVVYRLTGDVPGAARAQEEALRISRGLGDPLGEASALNELGVVSRLAGDLPAAARSLRQALGLVEKLGHRQAVAEVLNNLGALYQDAGNPQRARACHRRALVLARAVRSPLEQARALEGTARVAGTAAASTGLTEALKIYERIGAFEAANLAIELAGL